MNCELEDTIVKLHQDGTELINSLVPFDQPIYLHESTYRHFASTLQASAGQQTVLVPEGFASLKSFWCLSRKSTEILSLTSYSLSGRVNQNIATY